MLPIELRRQYARRLRQVAVTGGRFADAITEAEQFRANALALGVDLANIEAAKLHFGRACREMVETIKGACAAAGGRERAVSGRL